MIWMNEELYDYKLIGDVVDNNIVRIYIKDGTKEKILRIKHIPKSESNDITIDDITEYFKPFIHRVKSKSEDQINIMCQK